MTRRGRWTKARVTGRIAPSEHREPGGREASPGLVAHSSAGHPAPDQYRTPPLCGVRAFGREGTPQTPLGGGECPTGCDRQWGCLWGSCHFDRPQPLAATPTRGGRCEVVPQPYLALWFLGRLPGLTWKVSHRTRPAPGLAIPGLQGLVAEPPHRADSSKGRGPGATNRSARPALWLSGAQGAGAVGRTRTSISRFTP